MKRPSVWLIAVLVGALLLWKLASWSGQVAQRDQDAIQGAQAELAKSKPWHRQAARLAAASEAAQKRSQDALGRANVLTREVGRLRSTLPPNDTTPIRRATVDSLLSVAELRDSARVEQISALSIALAAERQRANLAEARVAHLETNLKAVVRVADCHVGGIGWLPRCPSRTTSLVLGAGLGATAVILAR